MTRTVVGVAALAATAVLAGCGTSPTKSPAAPTASQRSAGDAPVGKLIMIIRHGEGPADKGGPPGHDATGKTDKHALTDVGWQRAHALTGLFGGQGPTVPGIVKPATIYAAGANDNGEGERTRETVQALADKLGIPMNTEFGKGDEEALLKSVESQPGPTLISWQHTGIVDMGEALGSVTPTPPSDWPDERSDVIWTFLKTPTGWQFTQIPEMVMPGDQAIPITG